MIMLAIVALVLSAGITYLAYRVFQRRLQPPEVTDSVVVAAKKLPLGARITAEDVKLAQWPKSTPLEGAIKDVNLVIGRGPIMPLQVNEPILESKLAPKEAGVGLTAIIPEGMRALSIQVNSIIGVSGFVMPGSKVDLILTSIPPREVAGAKPEEQASKIILENLEVLAAGQNVQRDVDGKPQTVQDVTLLLTPEQAEKVALATGDGRIQLALRNPMDKEAAEPPLIVRSALYTGPTMEPAKDANGKPIVKQKPLVAEAKPPAALRASGSGKSIKPGRTAVSSTKPLPKEPVLQHVPPPPKTIVVEMIQGSKRSTENFVEDKPEEKIP
jgi:pilus assembly protein CpaB